MTVAYFNGKFLPLMEARVSVMDRGFLFGDGIYEVIPVYNGKIFRLQEHLERLKLSLQSIQMNISLDPEEFQLILNKLVKENGAGDQTIYVQITRGTYPERKFVFPSKIEPTILAYCSPLIIQSIEEMSQGISAITLRDIRWHYCRTKAITLLANILLRQEAKDNSADEAILIRDGFAIEGSSSNLFIVRNDLIITPRLIPEILSGITRQLVLELAKKHKVPCQQGQITTDDLDNADEVWLTSTSREIAPVLRLNGKQVNSGKPGPVWYKMINLFQAYKKSSGFC